MRLRAVRLRHVRQFDGRGVALEGFGDGVNVLAAPNEFGKSTIFDALKTALFFKATSRHREVMSLVPDPAGGAPEIEVDFDLEDRRLRLAKRFLSVPQSRLVDLEAGATVAAGDEVEDRLATALAATKPGEGPPGLLWLQQGTSLAQLAEVPGAPSTLREFVAREVGDMTGGQRTSRLLERAKTERLELVTAAQGRPRGDFERALHDHAQATAEVEALQERASAADGALTALARIDTELAEMVGDDAAMALARELDAARADLAAAGLARERQTARARELEQAREAQAHAIAASSELAKAHARGRANIDQLATARGRLAASRSAREQADLAVTRAGTARDQARQALECAMATTARARHQARATHATSALEEARARLEEALRQSDERRAKALSRGTIAVTPANLDALEAAFDLDRQATAQLATRRPSVIVRYDPDTTARVRIDGEPLADGREQSLARRTTLALDGIGQLTVDPGELGGAAELEAASAAATAELRRQLEALAVADVKSARTALREAQALDDALTDLDRTLAKVAPDGTDALAREIDAMVRAAETLDEGPPLDLELAEAAEADARLHAAAAEQRWREAVEAAGPAREAAAAAEARVEGLIERVDAVLMELGPEASWTAAETTAAAKVATRAHASTLAAEALAGAMAPSGDVDAAAATVRRLEEVLANHEQRLARLRLDRARLQGELRTAEAEGIGERLAEAEALLERRAARLAAYEARRHALDILIDVLATTEARARDRFTAPVLEAMRPLLAPLLPEAEVTLDGDFAPFALHRAGRRDGIERLSGGTREQIAVLARLAFARLLARHGRAVPVVLDDALVYSDDARIERMFTALTMAASEVQVLVLTCRERSFRRLGGTALRLEPWAQSEG